MATEVLKRLQRRNGLAEADRRSLATAFSARISAPPRHDIVRQDEAVQGVNLVLKGCACAYTSTSDGRRHIIGVYFPGDFCGLSALFQDRSAVAIRCLTLCMFARASSAALARLLSTQPSLALALLHECVLENAIQGTWLTALGRGSAHARTAHLLCELYLRARHAGAAHGSGCPLPLTQTDLADALGLSIVQVNRVLQSFRRSGMLSLERGILRIHDLERLSEIGGFTPAYLAFEEPPVTAVLQSRAGG